MNYILKEKQAAQDTSEKKEESQELALVSQDNNNETDKVMERVLPLAIQATHQMEFSNKNKHELDDEDLEKNIDKIALEGDLSPKKIDTIKASQGKKHKKGKNTGVSTMQTRSHSKHKSG